MIKHKLPQLVNCIFYTIITFIILFMVHYGLWIFVYDTYPVNTCSMYPTIRPGDKIFVNKLIFGARLYNDYNFSDSIKLNYTRVKGKRDIKHNDIIAFNQSHKNDWYRTSFKMNQVYLKRCIGLPSYTISIINGHYINSNFDKEILSIPLSKTYFIDLDSSLLYTYPYNKNFNWTIQNFGPLYIPKKGDTILLNEKNLILYKKYIEYETSKKIKFSNNHILLGEKRIENYTFLSNYYFMAGDNARNSRDSRYFGLVPEDFIIGVATRIIYSEDKYYHKIRYNRLFKKL